MKIRSKLSWTFIILLVVGIMSICSYAIVAIKNYLEQQAVYELQHDTRWLAVTVSNLADNKAFDRHFNAAAVASGYHLALYDSAGKLLDTHPANLHPPLYMTADKKSILKARGNLSWIPREENSEKLISYVYLPQSTNAVRYIRVSQLKDKIYAPIKTIRWKIYYGIFASMVLIVIVSLWISRYITKPITQIKNAAQRIADGDVHQQIDLKRRDEFGTLAHSLNQMATKLREDTEQIKQYAKKQRQFFADITHEIRNPLHTISGALEMLQFEELPAPKKDEYLRSANNQVERITRLFKDLKTLQRYDSDEYFVETQEFDLSLIARHMEEWHGKEAREKGITLTIDDHPCKVMGDPGKIEQVIDNLISNAIKYTRKGTVSLCYRQFEGQTTIEVNDTGVGISPEHLNRLFDRFYRTDNARSRDKGGTGLGLSVVKSILLAHDTDVEVESKVDEGSTFRFQLPAG